MKISQYHSLHLQGHNTNTQPTCTFRVETQSLPTLYIIIRAEAAIDILLTQTYCLCQMAYKC